MAIRIATRAIINGNKHGQHGNDKGARMAMIMAMLAIRMAINGKIVKKKKLAIRMARNGK